MSVFVLDKRQRPLMPCSEKRARKMLEAGRARIHRVMPFTIRLRDRHAESSALQPLEIKLDPGSKTTGIALVRKTESVDCSTGEIRRTVHAVNQRAILTTSQRRILTMHQASFRLFLNR